MFQPGFKFGDDIIQVLIQVYNQILLLRGDALGELLIK